jgi:hypothetical protein
MKPVKIAEFRAMLCEREVEWCGLDGSRGWSMSLRTTVGLRVLPHTSTLPHWIAARERRTVQSFCEEKEPFSYARPPPLSVTRAPKPQPRSQREAET